MTWREVTATCREVRDLNGGDSDLKGGDSDLKGRDSDLRLTTVEAPSHADSVAASAADR